jgi:hypothetical protein
VTCTPVLRRTFAARQLGPSSAVSLARLETSESLAASRLARRGGFTGMARRQRPLYEFVEPDQLEADDVTLQPEEPRPSSRTRSNVPARVGAGIALLAGVALFAVGVAQLGSPLRSSGRAANPSAARSVARSVLPAAPRRGRDAATLRRRAQRHPAAKASVGHRRAAGPAGFSSRTVAHPRSALAVLRAARPVTARVASA